VQVASLLHDDVLDHSDTRRGIGSLNYVMGNKVQCLLPYFLLIIFPFPFSTLIVFLVTWYDWEEVVMLTVDLSDGLVDGSLTCIGFVGRQLAVLAGDFLLARASVALASLRNTEVCTFSFGQWTVDVVETCHLPNLCSK
jgi:geranylgeranyl pyrophosphate synthase